MSDSGRGLADLVLRWFLGVILIIAGPYKIFGMGFGGFATYLGSQFAATPLPGFFITVFAHLLPFAELAIGVLLLLGWRRPRTLLAAALLFVVLAAGQFLLGYAEALAGDAAASAAGFGTAARNGIYVLAAVVALALDGPPRLALDGRTSA